MMEGSVADDWTTICRCGDDTVAVDPVAVIGRYAVHLTISWRQARGPGYTITHRASGFAVWHVREHASALAVARWLDEQLDLPDDAEELTAWKHGLSPMERARLVFQLSEIAPREWVTA